jgi:hypothetical protein
MKRVLFVIFIALFLSGCAGAQQSSTGSKGPGGLHATPAAGDASLPTPGPGDPVIILERSGGIAGIHHIWIIYADGKVTYNGQPGRTLTPELVNTSLADIQKSGFFNLQEDYGKNSTCNDCFVLTVTIRSDGNAKTVTAVEGDTQTPAEFLQTVGEINSLVAP